MAPRSKPVDKATIALGAVRCFQRYGVHRTSMEDVAQESGVSRQTVYRFFSTRLELLEHIAEQRMFNMAEEQFQFLHADPTLEDALIDGSLLAIRQARADTLFQEIITHSGEHSFDQFLFRGSDTVQDLMLKLWGPVLDKARAEGRLRPGVTNDQAVEWIRNVHAVLTMRDEDEPAQRAMLETFVLPSLLSATGMPTPELALEETSAATGHPNSEA